MSTTVRSPRSSKRKPVDADPAPAPKSPRKARNGKVEEPVEEPQIAVSKPADPTHSNKMHTLMIRTITGLVMIFGFILIMLSDHAIISAFVVVLQIMVYREMTLLRYREAKEKEIPLFRSLNWFFLASTLYYVYGKQIWTFVRNQVPVTLFERAIHLHLWVCFVLYILGFLLFVMSLRKETVKYQFGQLTWMLMTLLSVVVQSSVISLNIYHGLFWFMLPHSMIICNDIMAYFVGITIGKKFVKRPLTPLSPNKTWEGFFGAAVITVVMAFFGARLLGSFDWFRCSASQLALNAGTCPVNPLFTPVPLALYLPSAAPAFIGQLTVMPVQFHTIVIALFASIIAPFGGFFASAMKRAFEKKDFDQLIPGHGGVTDRMDCQFLIGLFIYVYYATFIKHSFVDVDSLLLSIASLSTAEQQQIYQHLQTVLSRAAI
jgi:phosphatidate cytidylyltransferase